LNDNIEFKEEEIVIINYDEFGQRLFNRSAEIVIERNLEYTCKYFLSVRGEFSLLEFEISGELPNQIKEFIKILYESEDLANAFNFNIEPQSKCTAGENYTISFRNKYVGNGYLTFDILSNVYGLNESGNKKNKIEEFWYSKIDVLNDWIINLSEPYEGLLMKGIYSFAIKVNKNKK